MIAEVGALHVSEKLLVVRDDDQLEVRLLSSCSDDVVQRLSQRPDVVPIEIGRRFIQCDELRGCQQETKKSTTAYLHRSLSQNIRPTPVG